MQDWHASPSRGQRLQELSRKNPIGRGQAPVGAHLRVISGI